MHYASMGIHIQVSRSRAQPPPLHVSGPYEGPVEIRFNFDEDSFHSFRKLPA